MKSLTSKLFLAACTMAALGSFWGGASGQDASAFSAKMAAASSTFAKTRLKLAGVSGNTLEKANKIIDEHTPKIGEAQAKIDAILTPAQQQTLVKAKKAARAANDASKKLDDISADSAAFESLNLPAVQKSKYDAAHKEFRAALRAQDEALRPLLTPEQQTKMGLQKLAVPKTK